MASASVLVTAQEGLEAAEAKEDFLPTLLDTGVIMLTTIVVEVRRSKRLTLLEAGVVEVLLLAFVAVVVVVLKLKLPLEWRR